MGHSAIWHKNLIVLLFALQFDTVPVRGDGAQIVKLDFETALFALEDDPAVRDVQDAAIGFILHIVGDVGIAFAIMMPNVTEKMPG